MKKGHSKTIDVTGIGAAVVDYVGVVESYPAPDTQVQLDQFHKLCGGNVATALVALQRLGISTRYLGKFGDDELSQRVRETLEQEGTDLQSCPTVVGGSMGFAFIIVEQGSGKRTILWTNQGKSHLSASELDETAILSSRFLHLDHYSLDAAIAAAKVAKRGSVQVVLDAESIEPGLDQLIPLVDVMIVCADFARNYTGHSLLTDALESLHQSTNAHTVVITDGTNGSYCKNNRQVHHQAAFPIDVVDTTGCGDVYHGAFIYGLLQSQPLDTTARFASAAAALNCRKLGGQPAVPSLHEVNDFLQTHSQY